jgi:hypothetical protein
MIKVKAMIKTDPYDLVDDVDDFKYVLEELSDLAPCVKSVRDILESTDGGLETSLNSLLDLIDEAYELVTKLTDLNLGELDPLWRCEEVVRKVAEQGRRQ